MTATADSEPLLTEADALTELVSWGSERHRWQQDAIRRLLTNGQLTETDINALASICLDSELPWEGLSKDTLSPNSAGDPIALLRLENPTGVNALAPNQNVQFAKEGLTVIYGDNGSGKSGYVRVLKHACRTRDRETAILRDVEDTAATPQTAKIVFARGSDEIEFDWTPSAAAHPELSHVSIFDARSANIHVEKTNAVAYIPLPMRVMESLADACDEVKAKLESKIQSLEAQTPVALSQPKLSADTAAGSFVHTLSTKSNLSQLTLLSTLSEEELARLRSLEADLAQDPKRAAARLSQQKALLEQKGAQVKRLMESVTEAAFQERDRLKADRDEKQSLSKLASDNLFAASPLPHIGESTWRNLWESARQYSDELAYPAKSFPEADEGDLCVLCQQPLGPEAIKRRLTFEEFVKGTAKSAEESAIAAFDKHAAAAIKTRIPFGDVRQLHNLIATEIGDTNLAAKVRSCVIRALWRLRAFNPGNSAPGSEAAWPEADITRLCADLGTRAAKLSADLASPEYLSLVKECAELKDREALQLLVEDIKSEIARKKEIDAIKKSIKETAKKSVTTKNKEFSDRLVTNALRGRFSREIEKLKLARMPVELRKTKDQNAVSYFQVCLVERPTEAVGQIFSEGEHRCVALAAFLAELVTAKRYSGIVFDDPMSSLDHIHRRSVAVRLTEEAQHRQVIVFTHDLTFLFELQREAESRSQPIHYQTIRRKQDRPGFVDDELPNKAKSTLQLTQTLRSELKSVKGQFEQWPDARRTLFCKGFIEQLREAWDQGIADFVFPVLRRFDNQIKGSSLFKLAVLTDADVTVVTQARGRLSEGLHASAETLNPESVTHDDLFAEIGKLETWLNDMSLRQKNAKPWSPRS